MIRRIFGFLASVLFLSILISIIVLHSDWAKQEITLFVEDWVEQETGYQLKIGRLAFTPPYEIRAQDLTLLRDHKPFALFKRATILLSPLSLFEKKIYIPYLSLEGKIDETPLNIEGELSLQFNTASAIVQINNQFKLAATFKDNQTEFYLKQLHADPYLRGKATFNREKGALLKITDGKIGPLFVSGRFSLSPQGFMDGSYLTVQSQPLPYPFTGSIRGKATLFGVLDAPQINLTLDSDEFSLWRTPLQKGRLSINAQWQHQSLLGTVGLNFYKENQPYHFQGSLTQIQRGAVPALKFFSSFQLEQLLLLADIDAPDTAATVDFEIIAPTNGKVDYQVHVHHGRFEIYEWEASVEQLEATFHGNLKKLHLSQLYGVTDRGGIISGHGELDLDPQKEFPYLVDLNLHDILLPNLPHWQVYWNGDLSVKGDFQQTTLQGALTTTSGILNVDSYQPEEIESIEVKYINQPPHFPPPTSLLADTISFPLNIDVHLKAPEGITIFGAEMHSEWHGDLNVKGTIKNPLVFGTLTLEKGSFEAGAKTFKMRRGTINFDGDPDKKTTLFLASEVEIDRISIELIAKGSMKNPTLALHSTPAMSQREILSWLLFNRGIEDIDPLQREELPFSFADLKSTSTSPDILTRIKKRTGLDVISIKQSAEGDPGKASFQIGKYISQGTLVTISHNVNSLEEGSKSAQCVGIETRLSKEFKIQAQIDDKSNGHLNLIWKKDY